MSPRSSTATAPTPAPVERSAPGVPTTDEVWRAIEGATFAVVSHTTPAGDPRSSGVLYKAIDRKLYVVTARDSWKARHLAEHGRVAVTVPVRRGGLLSLVLPIPPATICFHGDAVVHAPNTMAIPDDLAPLIPAERREDCSIIEIVPEGTFLTYGIGVPLLTMRDTARARGHAPVR